jgi:CheY-like chemotaxis protein
LEPLAASRSVDLDLHLPPEPFILPTDSMIARQVITSLLSLVIQQSLSSPLTIHLIPQTNGCFLQLLFKTASEPQRKEDPSIDHFAQNLGWDISHQIDGDHVEITVKTHSRNHTCLVIDDNPGFVELLERYVAEFDVRILNAISGQKGIEIAQQLQPNAIILDVMIPEVDGWQILQRLQSNPATKSIPVIICSVFFDPELAFTLGAVEVLKKPIRREVLTASLRKIGIL